MSRKAHWIRDGEAWAQVPADVETRVARADGLPEGFCVTWGYETALEEGYTPDEVLSLAWDGASAVDRHEVAENKQETP